MLLVYWNMFFCFSVHIKKRTLSPCIPTMHITFISIFPEVYTSFLETSLIKKSQEKNILQFDFVNPRDFCEDKHQQVDDEIYGGGAWMLLKAKPVIDAIQSVVAKHHLVSLSNDTWTPTWKIFFLSPSPTVFNQQLAYQYAKLDHIIFVSGRYEGIDHRFEQYMQKKYAHNFSKISLGQFVTLGWELPSMVMTESIVRLIPWVIKEESSHLLESYDPNQQMQNIEYPQYTRPEQLSFDEGTYAVPEVLLSGNHAEIAKWRKEMMGNVDVI